MPPIPNDPLLDEEPPDDVGALTQARFRYQADCAAQDCIRMLLPNGPMAIVCEWVEDYVVLYRDALPELVSVKHRESSQGPWTLRTLTSDGGLLHLFSRWNRYGRSPRARLCTNAGLKAGKLEAAALRAACANGDLETLATFAELLADAMGADASTIVQFLSVLRIDDDRPKRKDIAAVQAVWLRTPLRELGLDPGRDVEYYERIVTLILAASRDDPLAPEILLVHLNRTDALSGKMLRDVRLLTRLVDRDAVLSALRDPMGLVTPPDAVPTRMRRKLEAGGFGPTAVRRAQRLRAAWYAYSRAEQDSSSLELETVRDYVLEQAEASEERTQSERTYGTRMAKDLRETFEDAGRAEASLQVDARLLMGCALQLTDECLVWWSPESAVDLR